MVLCSNCHCDIEESKIFLHQRFCFQNIKYCEQCKVGVVIEEFEEHCQTHNNPKSNENVTDKLNSKESNNDLTLKRVQSSKVGCEYCGFLCGYSELEEHELMCGSRSTNCKKCGKFILYKNLKSHIEKDHNLNYSNYQEMKSGNINSDKYLNQNQSSSSGLFANYDNLGLKRMTTEEEIAYTLALCAEEEKKKKELEKKNNNEKKDKKVSSGNLSVNKKISDKIDYDQLDYEYEKEMFQNEMNEYNNDDEI